MKIKKKPLIVILALLALIVLLIFVIKPKDKENDKGNEVMDALVIDKDKSFNLKEKGKTDIEMKASLSVSKGSKEEIYYMYMDILENDLTSEEEKVIMSLQDPSGKEVTSIDGLTYKTVGDLKGFDITKESGLITLVSKRKISTSSKLEEKWRVTINVLTDSTEKAFSGTVKILQKELYENKLAKLCFNQEMGKCFRDNYKVDKTLVHHSGQGAKDNSIRYTGANTNNYVCFGSDEETCPSGNLYRIIGIFSNNVKLIKADVATQEELGSEASFSGRPDTSYYKGNLKKINYYNWGEKNRWSTASLNKDVLNGTYLNSLGDWSDKIINKSWKVGGTVISNIMATSIPAMYRNEMANGTTYDAKIGLMYISDYAFAATSDNWTSKMSEYNNDLNMKNNWMHLGVSEWTITPRLGTNDAFAIGVDGAGEADGVSSDFAVRPAFYLTNKTILVKGNGTSTDPFRIK